MSRVLPRGLRWPHRVAKIAVLCTAVGAMPPLLAQEYGKTTVSVFAGGSEYDLSGVGWTAVYGLRADHELVKPLVVQFAMPVYRYNPYGGPRRISYLLPEISLLASPRIGPVSPYLGVGSGWSFVVEGGSGNAVTLHAALGVRVHVFRNWFVRGEFLARSIDPWGATTADISGGIGYRF